MSQQILISNGEILDKFSILIIKQSNISDKIKLTNIENEIDHLRPIFLDILSRDSEIETLYNSLKDINKKLWMIEDSIRIKEKLQQFDSEFIDLARKVYTTNDERAKVKKQINLKSKSYLIEEKSYES
jgi:phenylalanyl-tRNA synthetase alpha subunit